MKPLLAKEIDDFLKRFDDFRNGEFRHMEIVSPTVITLTLSSQDEAKAFDWVSITLEFSGVSDALLVENSKLNLVDMSDGISILYKNGKFYFGVGKCEKVSSIKTSTCHIEGSSLKYEEGSF